MAKFTVCLKASGAQQTRHLFFLHSGKKPQKILFKDEAKKLKYLYTLLHKLFFHFTYP